MILTPAQWRDGARQAHDLARQEPERHLKRFLAAHAPALAQLAERIERDGARASGWPGPGESEAS